MTPLSPVTLDKPINPPAPEGRAADAGQARGPRVSTDTLVRLLVSAAVVVAYYAFREQVVAWLQKSWESLTGIATRPATVGVWLVACLLAGMVLLWRHVLKRDKRFHAPLLVTAVLLLGDAGFGILENHASALLAKLTGGAVSQFSPTFVAIVVTVIAEMLLGRFFYGKWPHLASAYVSGISAGILVKSPALWPFVFAGLISITSKYVLRIGDRHLWNPTNLGLTVMLFLAPTHVAPLSVQAGNEVWAVLVIWVLGFGILYQLKLVHIPAAFLAAFIPLSLFRAWWTGHTALTELAPMTGPMFQLFIFFMITDPKTITKKRWSQVLVVLIVAVVETILRLGFEDVHSLFHALFIVGPIANLIEICVSPKPAPKPAPAPAAPVPAVTPAG
jgi:hypothetical protein